MATYGYTRVSTTAQANEGESLDVQQRTLAGYAMMHGMSIDHMHVERGISGSVPLQDRPEGAAMLAALLPGDVIISPKLDRMFRSALDALTVLESLKQRGVSLHMIDLGGDVINNGVSKLVFTILSAVAESERDRIRERVATVKADQRKRGLYLGGIVPFGYAKGLDGMLEPVDAEQAMIGAARGLRATGASLRAVQTAIERDHGRRVSLDALQRVLSGSQVA
jgi:DNA invertase Pin-like site-specific DNA recombinase